MSKLPEWDKAIYTKDYYPAVIGAISTYEQVAKAWNRQDKGVSLDMYQGACDNLLFHLSNYNQLQARDEPDRHR